MYVPFVKLVTCSNEAEAELLKQILLDAGIPAGVKGSSREVALSFGGAGTGDLCIMVPENRQEDATAFLSELHKPNPRTSWFCSYCSVEVDGDFDVCWNCERSRQELESATENPSSSLPTKHESIYLSEVSEYQSSTVQRQDSNPYAAPDMKISTGQ